MQEVTSNRTDVLELCAPASNECGSDSGLRLAGLRGDVHEERDTAERDPGPGIAQILALRVGCWQPPLYVRVPLPAAS